MMSTVTDISAAGIDGVRPKTLRGLLLARELDTNRTKRGLTTRKLADQMRMSPAMCNRVMTGRRVPTPLEIGGLCALLDIPAHRRPALYELARTASDTQWIIHRTQGTEILSAIEAEAHTITSVCPSPIPGPLRTDAYNSNQERATPGHERLADRYLLHPAALRDTAVPRHVMREQLRHLTSAPKPVRLLPNSTPLHGAFRVVQIEHFHPVVWLEHEVTTVVLERPSETSPYTRVESTLMNAALSVKETNEALLRLAANITP
ncbi:helix-turn-helix transcriptional regulator [Actinokineospora sp. PR83]|uniref:helix-turn-helix domain-containing protein n=1 Tax=Actinokineospora sp. PR83 TaxID=2884908 RepID=UPI001F3A7050|nr:Scr1 family TA system antitoxin-like transcriptional regulator [Actinokineospora sp. PR83]MCG8918788.1 helix-turn-helix transcriptional regulator [Actinokineospora sp. PR83]